MDIQSKTINHNESEPNSSHKSEDKLILSKSLNTTEIKNAYLHKRPKIFKTKAKIQHIEEPNTTTPSKKNILTNGKRVNEYHSEKTIKEQLLEINSQTIVSPKFNKSLFEFDYTPQYKSSKTLHNESISQNEIALRKHNKRNDKKSYLIFSNHNSYKTNVPQKDQKLTNKKSKHYYKNNSMDFTLTESQSIKYNKTETSTLKNSTSKQSSSYKKKKQVPQLNTIKTFPISNLYKKKINKPFLERQESFLKKIKINRTKLQKQLFQQEQENILHTSHLHSLQKKKRISAKNLTETIDEFNLRNKEWEQRKQNKIASLVKQKQMEEAKEIQSYPYKKHKLKYTKKDIRKSCERLHKEDIDKRLLNKKMLQQAFELSFQPYTNKYHNKKLNKSDLLLDIDQDYKKIQSKVKKECNQQRYILVFREMFFKNKKHNTHHFKSQSQGSIQCKTE